MYDSLGSETFVLLNSQIISPNGHTAMRPYMNEKRDLNPQPSAYQLSYMYQGSSADND